MSFLFKSSGQPQQQSTPQAFAPQFSAEQKPFLQEIFGQAQTQYEAEKERGYTPFPGPQLAGFTPEEQQSFEMYRNIATGPGAQPFYLGATQAALGSAQDVLGPEIQARMSPYQQAVTDVAMREAARQFQTGPLQQIRTGATAEGGLRGARRAIAESEGMRNLEQRLADIQTLGSQQAYQQAISEAAAQRGRLAGLAGMLPGLGTGLTTVQQQQAALLGGVGELQRQQQQQAIDLARQEFAREEMYPVEALSRYLGFISGAPQPGGSVAQTQTVQGPSALSQFAGLVGGLGTLAGGLGGDAGLASFFKKASGGRVGGLSSIVRRQAGGRIVRMQEGEKVPAPVVMPPTMLQAIQSSIPGLRDLPSENVQSPDIYGPLVKNLLEREVSLGDVGEILTSPLGPTLPADSPIAQQIIETQSKAAPKVVEVEVDSTPVEQAVATTAKTLTQKDAAQQPVAPDTESDLEKMYVEALKKALKATEDTGMTWSERLQLAASFFAAGDSPDMFAFFKNAAAGAAPVFAGMEKADKARAQTALTLAKNAYDLQRDRRQDLREDAKAQAALMTATAALVKAGQEKPYKNIPKTTQDNFKIAYKALRGIDIPEEALAVIVDEAARSQNADPMEVVDRLIAQGVLGKTSPWFGSPTLEVQRQARQTPNVQYQIKP